MKNKQHWKPTKYRLKPNGKVTYSKSSQYVAYGSRLMVSFTAERTRKALQKYASGTLLDLGCGNVPCYHIYKDQVSDVTCVDWENSAHSNSHLDYSFDLNEKFPLKSHSYDTIFSSDVLEHIAKPDNYWQEISRVIKPGGYLILTVPFLYSIHEVPHDYCRYTRYKLAQFCDEHGFEVLELESFGGALEVISDTMAKLLGFSRLLSFFHFVMSKAVLLSFVGKIIKKMTKEKYPIGYILVAKRRKDV